MAVSGGSGPTLSVPKELFQTRVAAGVTANRMQYVASRDGKRFLINTQTGDQAPTPITVVLNWAAALIKIDSAEEGAELTRWKKTRDSQLPVTRQTGAARSGGLTAQ